MTLTEATDRLRTVFAAVRLMNETYRPLVFSGGLELEELEWINIVRYAFQVFFENGEYVGRVQGEGQLEGPSVRGDLAYVVEWLCLEGAESLRTLKQNVAEIRTRVHGSV